jgi:hypothetical protein
MGKAGQKHIEEHFSLKSMVDKTVDIYEQALRASIDRSIRAATVGSH